MKSIRVNTKATATLLCLFATMFFSSIAQASTTHTINITAETLPNGQLGYKMISHEGSDHNYPIEAVIPGPTLFVEQGDTVNITLINNTGSGVYLNYNNSHNIIDGNFIDGMGSPLNGISFSNYADYNIISDNTSVQINWISGWII